MESRSAAPAFYLIGASLGLLVLGVSFEPTTAGPLAAYALRTFMEPISILAALAIGIFVRRTWFALAAAVVAAVAIHYVVLSFDPDVAQLRRVSGEPVSDTFVLLARVWGMTVAVALVFLVAAGTRRLRGAGDSATGDPARRP